jgi:hypothetical protein
MAMIIGLTGYAQSGKDSVASVLIEKYGFERVAFADPIKSFLMELNPVLETGYRLRETVNDYGWELAKAKTEVRRLLQATGMAARTALGQDIWVLCALRAISDNNQSYVITDVRFDNEARMIKNLNGQLWRVERPGVGPVNDHVSETTIQEFEVSQTFLNSGTLEDLEAQVTTRMKGLLV